MTIQLLEASKYFTTNDGDHDNLQYVPDLCLEIVNLCKLLPLWSAIMAPYFKNAETVSSSAPVESNFNDIKNRVFKTTDLPTSIDNFVSKHIDILEGTKAIVEASSKNFQDRN